MFSVKEEEGRTAIERKTCFKKDQVFSQLPHMMAQKALIRKEKTTFVTIYVQVMKTK